MGEGECAIMVAKNIGPIPPEKLSVYIYTPIYIIYKIHMCVCVYKKKQ